MRLNEVLPNIVKADYEIHFSSKDQIYEKLLEKFPDQREKIHEILMPTPIDGKNGPSLSKSMLNLLLPISKNPPLVKQISSYLKAERALYDKEKFDLVVNDGDMGSNVLADNRSIPSLFVTNQFMPKLWKTRFYFYPSLIFIAKQIARATRILIADSPPPYTLCEYNLNIPEKLKHKITYVGHFSKNIVLEKKSKTDFEKLIENNDFGYWMRTGNKSTNDATGEKYEKTFNYDSMKKEKRIVSHAKNDSTIDKVLGIDGKSYSISDALEKKIEWIQIDIGYLDEHEKDSVLKTCNYAVVNGSHTVMGEILGTYAKPIIGIPIYDEHTNQLEWTKEKNLGELAKNSKQVIKAIENVKKNQNKFQEKLDDFKKNFLTNGHEYTATIINEMLEKKK